MCAVNTVASRRVGGGWGRSMAVPAWERWGQVGAAAMDWRPAGGR